jgi:hypothetical protein
MYQPGDFQASAYPVPCQSSAVSYDESGRLDLASLAMSDSSRSFSDEALSSVNFISSSDVAQELPAYYDFGANGNQLFNPSALAPYQGPQHILYTDGAQSKVQEQIFPSFQGQQSLDSLQPPDLSQPPDEPSSCQYSAYYDGTADQLFSHPEFSPIRDLDGEMDFKNAGTAIPATQSNMLMKLDSDSTGFQAAVQSGRGHVVVDGIQSPPGPFQGAQRSRQQQPGVVSTFRHFQQPLQQQQQQQHQYEHEHQHEYQLQPSLPTVSANQHSQQERFQPYHRHEQLPVAPPDMQANFVQMTSHPHAEPSDQVDLQQFQIPDTAWESVHQDPDFDLQQQYQGVDVHSCDHVQSLAQQHAASTQQIAPPQQEPPSAQVPSDANAQAASASQEKKPSTSSTPEKRAKQRESSKRCREKKTQMIKDAEAEAGKLKLELETLKAGGTPLGCSLVEQQQQQQPIDSMSPATPPPKKQQSQPTEPAQLPTGIEGEAASASQNKKKPSKSSTPEKRERSRQASARYRNGKDQRIKNAEGEASALKSEMEELKAEVALLGRSLKAVFGLEPHIVQRLFADSPKLLGLVAQHEENGNGVSSA